ncbi:MAG TPA: hypothetical protein ENH11_00060 [Candidatus Acetothermia bacterium]|nr:hypothetical protein [Candidatus Acetothermia bacterium]
MHADDNKPGEAKKPEAAQTAEREDEGEAGEVKQSEFAPEVEMEEDVDPYAEEDDDEDEEDDDEDEDEDGEDGDGAEAGIPELAIVVPDPQKPKPTSMVPPAVLARAKQAAAAAKVGEPIGAQGAPQAQGVPRIPQPVGMPTPLPAQIQPMVPNNKLILRNGQSPGDGILLAFAALSLQQSYPGLFQVDLRTPYQELYEGMYGGVLSRIDDKEAGVTVIDMNYETIHQSNQRPYFYMMGMVHDLSLKLKLPIAPAHYQGFLPVRDEEKGWFTAPRQDLGKDVPYWVINAGWKDDYTAKQWSTIEYQRLIDMFPNVYFAQIGHKDHNHPVLEGPNVLNYVGKTDLRQMVRLIWGAYGVITPCSMAMLLAYALPACERWKMKSRACIALGGGREPNHWQQGPNQQYMHTCGMLDCCDYGGCWKSRVTPLNDGDGKDGELCTHPVKLPNGQIIGKCMDMIRADDIARLMLMYIQQERFDSGSDSILMKAYIEGPEMPKGMRQLPGLVRQKQNANAQQGKSGGKQRKKDKKNGRKRRR